MNISSRGGALAIVGLMLLPGLAVADSRPVPQSEAWLTLQRNGGQASPNAQPLTELERDKAVARFLKTYDYPIPSSYYGTKFGVGSK